MRVEIKKWEDLSSAEIIFKLLRKSEFVMGEDFIDQNESIVKDVPFVSYLLGKGIVSPEFISRYVESDTSLQDFLSGYEDENSLFPMGECDERAHAKGYALLADYIFKVDFLRKKLFKILEETTYGYEYGDKGNRILKEKREMRDRDSALVLEDGDFEDGGEFNSLEYEWQFACNHTVEQINDLINAENVAEKLSE